MTTIPDYVTCVTDAITVADAALGVDDLAALLYGDVRFIMPVSGVIPDEGVETLDGVLLRGFGDENARLVLATRRVGGGGIVLERELSAWQRMLAAHEGRALRLVDWLIFTDDGDTALSVGEIAGPEPVWA